MKYLLRLFLFCFMSINTLVLVVYNEQIIEDTKVFINNVKEDYETDQKLTIQGILSANTNNDGLTETEMSAIVSQIMVEIDKDIQTFSNETLEPDLTINETDEEFLKAIKLELYNELIKELSTDLETELALIEMKNIEEMILNVVDNQVKSIVGVSNELREFGNNYKTVGTGSGVIFHKNLNEYYVVTNEHVVRDASRVSIYIEGLGNIVTTVVGVDRISDLAVLKFSSQAELTISSFSNSDVLKQGQIVIAMGNPLGYTLYRSVTMGVISGLNRHISVPSEDTTPYTWVDGIIQHDAPISPGNSGGPLFDLNGNIIGLNNAVNTEENASNIGFAIPSNTVVTFIESLNLY